MRIYGDTKTTSFTHFSQEPGMWGTNDVLEGSSYTSTLYSSSFWGETVTQRTHHAALYLHILKDTWSTLTAVLRKILLFWRWDTIYLDSEDGTNPKKALVCTWVRDGDLPEEIQHLLGKSWLVTNLIKEECYQEIFRKEHIRIKNAVPFREHKISDPLGDWCGRQIRYDCDILCHIYRKRSLYSTLMYYFLKFFSNTWKEVTLMIAGASETILIRKEDQHWLTNQRSFQIL